MEIQPITKFTPVYNNKKTTDNLHTPQKHQQSADSQTLKSFAYRDYNITFTGRTPENFYAQKFNRENMPVSMLQYLNYDYETRQHIPPEQMMSEVFKYLAITDNFTDVKSIYPDEDLFKNLHENKIKNRTTLLAEIRMAKELDNAPLLNDGSDNFGMYLLRKIYLEGKTLKEINKDFYEKDLNVAYKGIITKPLNQEDTSAYGIKFPKKAFWLSFIATRDEYRKFYRELPKNSVNPAAHVKNHEVLNNKITKGDIPPEKKPYVPRPRKYEIDIYDKKHLTDEIKTTTPTVENVARKVRRRFGSSDPETSFIIKYLSPIMAVAADRVHLSEEMKMFCEDEKLNGKKSDDEAMFKRFWKQNPDLLDYYAQTITDTMDYFEEVYSDGGLIPINNDLEEVTPDTKNKNIIDRVSPEFLELLNYTQTIKPERDTRYEEHDKLQKQWEEYFTEKYDDINEITPAAVEEAKTAADDEDDLAEGLEGVKKLHPEFSEDLLRETAAKFNADVWKLKSKDGNDILITANLDEVFDDYLKNESKNYPSAFAKKYIHELKENRIFNNEKTKLSIAAQAFIDKIDDERVYSEKELDTTLKTAAMIVTNKYRQEAHRAYVAMIDTLIEKCPEIPHSVINLPYWEITPLLDSTKGTDKDYSRILTNNKHELNAKYASYSEPLSKNQKFKISKKLTQMIAKYQPSEVPGSYETPQTVLLMLKDSINNSNFRKEDIEALIRSCLNERNGYFREILDSKITEEQAVGKLEMLMNFMIPTFLNGDNFPILLAMINKDNLMRHKSGLDPETRMQLITAANALPLEARMRFEMTDLQDREFDKLKTQK